MDTLFESLTHALSGSPALAIGAAVIWGVLSIVLSPCHLASIPLVVSVVGGQEQRSPGGALLTSSVFSLGILLTIVVVGLLTAFAGRMLGDLGGWVNYLVGGVFLLVGLYLLGVIPLNWSPMALTPRRTGLGSALAVGLIFGLAVGPCTFAYMAPMLGVTFKIASSQLILAVMLLLAYAVGHCAVIVLAGVSTGLVQRYLNWTDGSRGALMRRAMGGLVIVAGLLILWAA